MKVRRPSILKLVYAITSCLGPMNAIVDLHDDDFRSERFVNGTLVRDLL